MRPVRQTKHAARKYPIQTQIHDCHQDRPSTIIEEEIIHVFYLYQPPFGIDISEEMTYDIQRIGDPKGDEIVPAPQASFGVD